MRCLPRMGVYVSYAQRHEAASSRARAPRSGGTGSVTAMVRLYHCRLVSGSSGEMSRGPSPKGGRLGREVVDQILRVLGLEGGDTRELTFEVPVVLFARSSVNVRAQPGREWSVLRRAPRRQSTEVFAWLSSRPRRRAA